MGTVSDATGLPIRTKASTDKYKQGWDAIFGKDETPVGEDTRPKDRVKLGVSPSANVTEVEVNTND